jgi:hypothetical protein
MWDRNVSYRFTREILTPVIITGRRVAARSAPVKKYTLGAAARKRIAEATRKRWAEFRKKKAAKEK